MTDNNRTTKYLFFDLDGTLKGRSNEIRPSAKAAIANLREQGHKVFLCSGRSPEFLIRMYQKDMPMDGIIGCAGSSVLVGDSCIFENRIPDELLDQLLKVFHELKMDYSLETTIGIFRTTEQVRMINELFSPLKEKDPEAWERIQVEETCGAYYPLEEYKKRGRGVQKICFTCYNTASRNVFFRYAQEQFHIVTFRDTPDLVFGEIILKNATKAKGIQNILVHYGASPSDAIGFGDSMNDFQMMQYVGTRVVSEHGPKVLRDLADYIFPDPDQDGIATVIENMKKEGRL